MAVASREWPGFDAIAVQQLTPELAEPLAAAELAIFVDARRSTGTMPSRSGRWSQQDWGGARVTRAILGLCSRWHV